MWLSRDEEMRIQISDAWVSRTRKIHSVFSTNIRESDSLTGLNRTSICDRAQMIALKLSAGVCVPFIQVIPRRIITRL